MFSPRVSKLSCLTAAAAVAILFAAVSNQEKLVTPRLATLDTKSTLIRDRRLHENDTYMRML